jgi:hypothetical protein
MNRFDTLPVEVVRMIFDATDPDDIRSEGEEFGRHRRIDKRSREIKGPMTIFGIKYCDDPEVLASLSKAQREAIKKLSIEARLVGAVGALIDGLSNLEELQISHDFVDSEYDPTGTRYWEATRRILTKCNLKSLFFRGCDDMDDDTIRSVNVDQ